MKSNIIIFSGLDGCGKSTQINKLKDYFDKKGIKYKIIWARPGSTPFLIWIKSIARFFISTLPSEGRSDKRSQLLNKSILGDIWFFISFLELIYIFKLKSFLLNKLGYFQIYDRHLIDAFIDYKVLFNHDIKIKLILNYIPRVNKGGLKIYLSIPIDESIKRCSTKYEPYPDTIDEKCIRESYYIKYMKDSDYITLDGLENSEELHKKIINFIL